MNYLAIALVFIIVLGAYYVYGYITNNTLTSGLQPLNRPVTFTYDKLINPNSYTYSYQCWLYLSNPVSTQVPLFYRGDDKTKDFGVYVKDNTLTLHASSGSLPPLK